MKTLGCIEFVFFSETFIKCLSYLEPFDPFVLDLKINNVLIVPGFSEEGDELIGLFCLFNKQGSPKGLVHM